MNFLVDCVMRYANLKEIGSFSSEMSCNDYNHWTLEQLFCYISTETAWLLSCFVASPACVFTTLTGRSSIFKCC